MISKKVITQTIPTVYTDNEEFMIARDSFNNNLVSENTTSSKIKPTSIIHNHASNFNFNPSSSNSFNKATNVTSNIRKMNISLNNGSKKTNDKNSATSTTAAVNPVSFFDFHLKNETDLSMSTTSKKSSDMSKQKTAQYNQAKASKNIDNESSPNSVPTTPFQNTFQKFVIERHVNHFNHRQPSMNSSNTNLNSKQLVLDKRYVSEEGPLTTAGLINSLNNKSSFYNKSYFYSENASDTKSLNDNDRMVITEKVSAYYMFSIYIFLE